MNSETNKVPDNGHTRVCMQVVRGGRLHQMLDTGETLRQLLFLFKYVTSRAYTDTPK